MENLIMNTTRIQGGLFQLPKVNIKGVGKVLFPDNMAEREISDVIQREAKRLADLDRVTGLGRLERAVDQGFDIDNPIYSGTGGEPAKKIFKYGDDSGGNNLFGGVFGSFDEEVAGSHGKNMQKFYVKNHIGSDEFNRLVFYSDDYADKADDVFRDIIKEHKPNFGDDITSDEFAELLDYTMGEKHIEETAPDMGFDRFNEIMGTRLRDGDFESLSDQGWDFQGLKGELARRMGFDAVGMVDEHGESVLVLAGRRADAAFDPAKKESSNLLASTIPAAVAVGAATQSDESEAGVISKVAKEIPDLLKPINQSKMVGSEIPILDTPDLKVYQADPWSPPQGGGKSYRYVKYKDGEPVGTLQFSTKGPRSKKAVIQNVHTAEGYRREGVATELLNRARKDFDIKHSTDLTNAGKAWRATVPAAVGASLFTPEENKAYADYLAKNQIKPNDLGVISAEEFPALESAGDFLNKYFVTPAGPVFPGVAQYLKDFGAPKTTENALKTSFEAALDVF